MKTRNWLFFGGVGVAASLLVTGILAWSLWSPAPVEVAEVQMGPIREYVDERGKTRVPQTYLITMPIAGRVQPITLTEGDAVTKDGEPVAGIVPEDLELAVERATAAVERLEASIIQNRDADLEQIALRQANHFVESMRDTVLAAAKQVESSQAKLDYSTRKLTRLEGLRSTRASSEDDVDVARLNKAEDALAVDQDRLTYQGLLALQVAADLVPNLVQEYINNKDLADTVLQKEKDEALARFRQITLDKIRGTISSPVDGVVLKRYVSDECTLSAGDPLLEIGRREDLEIEADVLSIDVVDVKEGYPVEIYGPAVGKPLPNGKDYARGAVHKIYPAGFTKISSLGVEQQRVKVIIRIEPEDLRWLLEERGVGIGYRVRVRITTAEDSGQLVIPRSALFRGSDGGWNVYAVCNGRVLTKPVEIGMLNDELAQVTSGLAAGDLVVRAPDGDLEENERVKAVKDAE